MALPFLFPRSSAALPSPASAHRGAQASRCPRKAGTCKSPHHLTDTGSLSVRGLNLISLPPAEHPRGHPFHSRRDSGPEKLGRFPSQRKNPGLTPEPTPTAFRVSELDHALCSLALAPRD